MSLSDWLGPIAITPGGGAQERERLAGANTKKNWQCAKRRKRPQSQEEKKVL